MRAVAGIDGCPGGWICVLRGESVRDLHFQVLGSIEEVLTMSPVPALVLVDIPIGLLRAGPRQCEREARKLLGWPRSASVFAAPLRACIAARSWEQACSIRVRAEGKKISLQSWGIVPKIRQVDAFLERHPAWKGRLREVHPELSFATWNGGRSMTHGKKTAEGRAERERLVHGHFGRSWEKAAADLPRGTFARDDLLDAFAALWSAERAARGQALVLPSSPQVDGRGLRAEILA